MTNSRKALLLALFFAVSAGAITDAFSPATVAVLPVNNPPAEKVFRVGTIVDDMAYPDPLLNMFPILSSHVYLAPVAANYESLHNQPGRTYKKFIANSSPWGYVPQLLRSVPSNIPSTECRVTLKKGIVFHDGSILDAHDLAFTIRTIRSNNRLDRTWGNIFKNIEVVEVIDNLRLKLSGPKPFSCLEAMMFTVVSDEIPRPADSADFRFSDMMGSGPYQIEHFDSEKKTIFLERFDQFILGRPYFDRIEILYFDGPQALSIALLDGRIDYAMHLPPDDFALINRSKRHTTATFFTPAYATIFFNPESKILDSIKVRQALSLLIDRENLFANNLAFARVTTPTDRPLCFAIPYKKPAVGRYRPDEAMRLLDEEGWKPDNNGRLYKDGKPFLLDLEYRKGPGAVFEGAVRNIISTWNDAGIGTGRVRAVAFPEFYDNYDGGSALPFTGDLTMAWSGDQKTLRGGRNYFYMATYGIVPGEHEDMVIDRLFEELDKYPEEFEQIRTAMQERLWQVIPSMPLFYMNMYGAINSRYPMGGYIYKNPWTLDFLWEGPGAQDKLTIATTGD